MRYFLCAVVAALALACGGKKGPEAPSSGAGNGTSGDAFAAVFRVVEQWRQGWEVRSLDALTPLYRQDDNTVVVYQGRSHVSLSGMRPAVSSFQRSCQWPKFGNETMA